MIDPKELRIGNWVRIPDRKTHGQILFFSLKFIKLRVLSGIFKASTHRGIKGLDVEPIEVTPEILERSGFDGVKGNDKYGGWLSPAIDGHRFRIRFDKRNGAYFKNDFMTVSLKYLHELQNFYCSLTKTELQYVPA